MHHSVDEVPKKATGPRLAVVQHAFTRSSEIVEGANTLGSLIHKREHLASLIRKLTWVKYVYQHPTSIVKSMSSNMPDDIWPFILRFNYSRLNPFHHIEDFEMCPFVTELKWVQNAIKAETRQAFGVNFGKIVKVPGMEKVEANSVCISANGLLAVGSKRKLHVYDLINMTTTEVTGFKDEVYVTWLGTDLICAVDADDGVFRGSWFKITENPSIDSFIRYPIPKFMFGFDYQISQFTGLLIYKAWSSLMTLDLDTMKTTPRKLRVHTFLNDTCISREGVLALAESRAGGIFEISHDGSAKCGRNAGGYGYTRFPSKKVPEDIERALIRISGGWVPPCREDVIADDKFKASTDLEATRFVRIFKDIFLFWNNNECYCGRIDVP